MAQRGTDERPLTSSYCPCNSRDSSRDLQEDQIEELRSNKNIYQK